MVVAVVKEDAAVVVAQVVVTDAEDAMDVVDAPRPVLLVVAQNVLMFVQPDVVADVLDVLLVVVVIMLVTDAVVAAEVVKAAVEDAMQLVEMHVKMDVAVVKVVVL